MSFSPIATDGHTLARDSACMSLVWSRISIDWYALVHSASTLSETATKLAMSPISRRLDFSEAGVGSFTRQCYATRDATLQMGASTIEG